jgi:hypothetical protein
MGLILVEFLLQLEVKLFSNYHLLELYLQKDLLEDLLVKKKEDSLVQYNLEQSF